MKIKLEDLKVLGPDMFIVMNPKDYEELVAKYGDNTKVKTTDDVLHVNQKLYYKEDGE